MNCYTHLRAPLCLFSMALCSFSLLAAVPSSSRTPTREEAPKQATAKCQHEAPKESCFICNPALREKGRLWCKEHGSYEDRCWECHPESQDKDRAFCKEHKLYENECFLCNPDIKAAAKPAPEAAGDKCAAHGAPKRLCFLCDPTLREKGRLWCKEHGSYEDRCWECHPESQDKARTFCKEHKLYEDECFLCRPELKVTPGGQTQAPAAPTASLMCREHQLPESECGICHNDLVGELKPGQGLKVRFPSAQAAEKAGIKTARPSVGPIDDSIECYAEMTFNQNKLAQIAFTNTFSESL